MGHAVLARLVSCAALALSECIGGENGECTSMEHVGVYVEVSVCVIVHECVCVLSCSVQLCSTPNFQ